MIPEAATILFRCDVCVCVSVCVCVCVCVCAIGVILLFLFVSMVTGFIYTQRNTPQSTKDR